MEDASVNKSLWNETLNKYPMEDTSVNKASRTEALNKYLMEDASVNKASVTEALNKFPEEDASVNITPWTEALNKYLMENASVNKAPVTEALDQCLVDDASVNKASLSEGCMNKCYYLMEDVPDASVNNNIRNKYLVEDVLVNKSLATVAFKNKVLVEHAYVKKAPAPGNDAPVAEDLGNKILVEDASMNEIPDTLNEALVKQEIMPDQSDKINSEPCREVSPECPNVKEECVSEGEESVSEESESDTEIEDIMNYLKADKKLIKITEDSTSTEENAELGNRRRSSRVQSRGYRPNYASLDWIDDHEKNSDDYVSEIVVTMEDKQIHGRRKHTSPADTAVTEDDKFRNDFKTKRNDKRKVKDPDFFPDEIECFENLDESDDSSETDDMDDEESYMLDNEGDDLTESKTSNKDMRKRKRKIGKSAGNNCKKRKKSWVHIKLEEHQDKYSKEIVKSFARKDRNVDVTEELFKCLICGNFKSTARDLFEEHIEKHVNKVLECDKCSYVGYSEFVLLKHKFSVGHASGKKQFICDICGIVLYTSVARLTHMGKEHGDPQFKCSYCDEKFATNNRRRKHYRTVHTDLVKYCFNCETDYRHLSLEYFRDHQSSCKVTNQCQVCGVCLSTKSGLKKHIESIHMNVRNYQCSTCPYSAKCSQRLKEHELSHRSDHQFFCDKCTFTCVQKYQLKSHMRTHTGEKPYKCSQCKFAAAWNVQLKEHVKVHGMENTVACSHCDIVFRNQKALKMHEKKDHPEIPGNIKKSKKRR
ncbi:zinc finger protein 37-like [Ruditapes philippinarum]|uniref:zinc finger protein 37-like n=1 Tax=Ruditapes philippinarum TaxID=129788 RepID=UPI00295BFCDE|nr:zinc finger protein 37-like [Ruditapes philippinarum]